MGLITNPMLEPIEFIREILYQFGLDPASHSKHDLLNALGEMMMKDFKENKATILVIDEAQLLSSTNFEEVRLLLNYQFNDRFLLNLLLIGQPELRGIIKRIEQLDSRIAIRYHLGPLSLEDMVNYVNFRLTRAGAKREIFTSGCLRGDPSADKGRAEKGQQPLRHEPADRLRDEGGEDRRCRHPGGHRRHGHAGVGTGRGQGGRDGIVPGGVVDLERDGFG